MSNSPSRSAVLPAAWTDVLEQITQGLEHAVAQTLEREQALQASAPAEASAATEAICRSLAERRQAWLDGLENFIQQAAQNASATEEGLDAGVAAAQRWLEKTATLRQKLAERTKPSV